MHSSLNTYNCLQGWLKHGSPSIRDAKDDANLQSLVLLLKCLKIMENAAFLSKDNQVYVNIVLLVWCLFFTPVLALKLPSPLQLFVNLSFFCFFLFFS